jgi:N-hydroxyarylamine O-acetyltransferase
MVSEFDIDGYCARIGYSGPRRADLGVLRDLHALHPAAVTFENIDVLVKRPIRLDLAAIADKIIKDGRGGYCYEQNNLFMAALGSLGFTVRSMAGRVQLNMDGAVTARNHMVLLVSLPEGEHIADVGFGGLTLTAPLRFEPGLEQTTPHGVYRITRSDDEFQLQARLDGQWTAMYQFSLAEQAPADWDMANWFMSTSPDSIFTKTLIVARPVGESRHALRNNRLRVYRADGTTEQRLIASADELLGVLRGGFDLRLPSADELAGIMKIAGVASLPQK